MAMGKRVAEGQESFWIATADLPSAPGHPFYERLNKILRDNDFDRFVETRCRIRRRIIPRSAGPGV